MSIASLYPSINPSLLLDFANVKRLDPRITFTRTTTATYYDGVTTAKAEQNLLTYSQEFDNAAWSKTASTVTANSTTAPDGTSTADTLTETATTNYHSTYQTNISLAATSYTFSCFAKPNGRNEITLVMLSGSDTAYATYNVSTGSITVAATTSGSFSSASTTITASANGFYRVTLTATAPLTSTATIAIELYNAARSYAGNGTSGVYLWGAQLEQRSSATAYTASTTQAITNYIPVLQTASAGQARFDHNPTTGESLGLLIEEARTNACPYSEDFSDAGWNKSSVTISSNQTIAPNGSLTADKLIPSSTGIRYIYRGSFSSSGSTSTVSVYLKYGGYQWTYVECYLGRVWFDVLNGVKGAESGATGTITAVGNGWYRCTVTETTPAGVYVTVGLSSANSSTTVTVATNDVFSGVFLWGAQAEVGASFATSYIPTVASSVTRNADAASMTGTNFSSWFNADLGSWYAEAATSSTVSSGRILSVSPASGSTEPVYSINYESNGTIRIYQVVNGSATYDFRPGNYSANTFSKIASCYKVGDYAGVVNSGSASTSSSQVRLPALSYLQIGALTSGSFFLNGTIKKISYYPIRVTNTQLQSLTV